MTKEPKHGTTNRYASRYYKCRCDLCRAAATEYQRQRRLRRPDVVARNLVKVNERRKELRNFTNELKSSNPCTDCGLFYPPYVMQYDHLDSSTKEFGIATLPSKERIIEEIAKCELVCANCHAIRTHNRRLLLTIE